MSKEIKCKVIDEKTNKEEHYRSLLKLIGETYVAIIPYTIEKGNERFQRDLQNAIIEAAQRDLAEKLKNSFKKNE